jgi:hypothetical protein
MEDIMDYIQLKPSSVKRFGIKNADGVDTGEYIEIDIEDLNLPKKAEISHKKHAENVRELNNKRTIINRKEDHKGKDELYSDNEKELMDAIQEFYKKEEEAIDEFIGEGATKKLLNGRNPYVTMYEDISDYLEQIIPILKESQMQIIDKIKTKYGKEEEDNIL